MDNYTFPLPGTTNTDNNIKDKQYPVSPAFDFNKGEFILNGKGDFKLDTPVNSAITWCNKVLGIERYSKLAYSKNCGIELEQLELYDTREAKESWLKRTIEETLLADPKQRILTVDNFTFSYDKPDAMTVTVDVTLKNGVVFNIEKEF